MGLARAGPDEHKFVSSEHCGIDLAQRDGKYDGDADKFDADCFLCRYDQLEQGGYASRLRQCDERHLLDNAVAQ